MYDASSNVSSSDTVVNWTVYGLESKGMKYNTIYEIEFTYCRDHGGARVATQAVFEDAREFGVAERHKHKALAFALPERVDAVGQRQQRPVDVAAVSKLQAS